MKKIGFTLLLVILIAFFFNLAGVSAVNVTVEQVINSSGNVNSYIEINHTLPGNTNVGENQVTMPQYLKLSTTAVLNINASSNATIPIISYSSAPSPSENITSINVSKAEYLNIASRVKSYMDTNGRAPNYASTSTGTIRYESLIYMYSQILNSYKINGVLPDYITVNPWTIVTNPNIIGNTSYGYVEKEFYGNQTSNQTIVLIIGVHPQESGIHTAIVNTLASKSANLNKRYVVYNVHVTQDASDYIKGRMNGQLLAQAFVVPDVSSENPMLVMDNHENHGADSGYAYYRFLYPISNTTITTTYANEIISQMPFLVLYSPSNPTSTPYVTVPIANQGITTIIYETYMYDSETKKTFDANTLINALDNLGKEAPTGQAVNASPKGGTFNTSKTVTLTKTDSGSTATIYYTTDGSNPQTSSTRTEYIDPITINITTTLKFYAVDTAGNPSPVYTEIYTINLAPADLRTETITTNGNTATGITNYPVSSTVKNYGGTITKTFYVSYYLSTDQYKSSNDRYIGHATVNGLASGSSVNAQILGSIPKDIAQGNYYIIAVADSTGIIRESNEANNAKTSASRIFIWRPDLSVQTVTLSGNTATGITNYSVSSTIKNSGSITSDTFYVSYYLSTDTTKSSNDRYIGHATVNGLNGWSTTTATAKCTIPKDIAQGNYYIIAVADSTGLIRESNEANNIRSSASKIFVWRPDLSVQKVTQGGNSARGATGYSVSSTVKNGGSITSGTFYVSYYLSTDAIKSSSDRYIGRATVNGLNGWSTVNAVANCSIPANIARGYYYIIAVADSTGLIPESNESNNNRASTTRIYIS